jgi:hypothetical protein
MDWACSMRKIINSYRILFDNLKGRVYLEYLGVVGRTGLNWQRMQRPIVTFPSTLV